MKLSLASSSLALVALASSINEVDAFVPVSAPAITNNPSVAGKSSFVPTPANRGLQGGRSSATTLAMQGNLFDRFFRVFNANANKIVSQLEDPEKVIIQAVDDMQVSLRIG